MKILLVKSFFELKEKVTNIFIKYLSEKNCYKLINKHLNQKVQGLYKPFT